MDTDKALDEITWFGHASFLVHDKLNGRNIYYLDPYDLKEKPKAYRKFWTMKPLLWA